MKKAAAISGWFWSILFFLLFLLNLFSGKYIPSIPVLIITILLIPPIREKTSGSFKVSFPLWLRTLLVIILLLLSIYLNFKDMGNDHSIYKNPVVEKKLMSIYDNRLAQWPVPYESRFLDTEYGKVHVIISGPKHAPPIFLLHASAMSGWSWVYNIEGLAKDFRTYAIDTIGDAGKSVLNDVHKYPDNGTSLTKLYEGIMDTLGVRKAVFVGASQGGYISTIIALNAPDRVTKLILCGPMGFTGTSRSVLRILVTTMFPLSPIQKSTARWAFGNDPAVNEAVDEWFSLILEGVISRQAQPKQFTETELSQLSMPVLLLLGERDGLVGYPERTKDFVQRIRNIRVEVLDTGHLISAEKPELFNKLVLEFIYD